MLYLRRAFRARGKKGGFRQRISLKKKKRRRGGEERKVECLAFRKPWEREGKSLVIDEGEGRGELLLPPLHTGGGRRERTAGERGEGTIPLIG